MPIKSIMDRVGHSNAKITLEIYSHTTEDMEDKLVNKLDTIFEFCPSIAPFLVLEHNKTP